MTNVVFTWVQQLSLAYLRMQVLAYGQNRAGAFQLGCTSTLWQCLKTVVLNDGEQHQLHLPQSMAAMKFRLDCSMPHSRCASCIQSLQMCQEICSTSIMSDTRVSNAASPTCTPYLEAGHSRQLNSKCIGLAWLDTPGSLH